MRKFALTLLSLATIFQGQVQSKTLGKAGLQVEVTKKVSCKPSQKAQNGDKVTVHYGGFLQDGELKYIIQPPMKV